MTILDGILGILLAYGLYKGLKNGLFVEVASIIALIGGIYGAIHFSYLIGNYLEARLDWNLRYIQLTSYILTFLIIVIVVQLLGKFLTGIADLAMLGMLNNLAGGVFGMLKVAVVLGALLVYFQRTNAFIRLVDEEALQESLLYPPLTSLGSAVFHWVLEPSQEAEATDPLGE